MNNKCGILICEHFKLEIEKILELENIPDLELSFFPARCGIPQILTDEIVNSASLSNCSDILVIGGCCLSKIKDFKSGNRNFYIKKNTQCFQMITDKVRIDDFIKNNSYILTSGWLVNWKNRIDEWGFDQQRAKDFFSESTNKLVLLDTGVLENSDKYIKEFSEYINLPYEKYFAGLDFFQLYLVNQIRGWKNNLEIEILKKERNEAMEKASDTAMALDMLSNLTKLFQEEEIIKNIIELFTILFAAEKIYYIQNLPGEIGKLYGSPFKIGEEKMIRSGIKDYNSDYILDDSGYGFYFHIKHHNELLGTIKVQGLGFPQYKEKYLELALSMSGNFGMAIRNSRNYTNLIAAEKKQNLFAQILELFLLSKSDCDELQEILGLLHQFFDIEALAIRMKKENDYPYINSLGFQESHMDNKDCIFTYDKQKKGEECNTNKVLGCLCGAIINKETDSRLPCFTNYGSFWTNNLSNIEKNLINNGINIKINGKCLIEGYESMALIPLYKDETIYGILQLSDTRSDIFTHQSIEYFEKVGSSIGIAHSRRESIEILKKAKSDAEAANLAKSVFLANISHELRTPLNAVLGFSEILRKQETDSKKLHFLNSIHSSGDVLLSLINDVLDLSKIEAGKIELCFYSTKLSTIVKEMEYIFSSKIKEKGISFITNIDSNLPDAVYIDHARIRQILINLIGNAVKCTKKGSVNININKLDSSKSKSGYVDIEFIVKDTGKGIPQNELDKIFMAFHQVKDHNNSKISGTGLGLAIVKGLLESLGGKIFVASKLGEGSVFTFTLIDVRIGENVDDQNATQFSINDSVEFLPATILIADDIDYNRELLTSILEDFSLEFLYAKDGVRTIELAEKHIPDLILLDMKMPIMDGYQVAEKLKKIPKCKDIPIIAVTASALKQDESKISKLCNSYLRKPINRDILIREMMRFLEYKTVDKYEEINIKKRPTFNPEELNEKIKKIPAKLLEDLIKQTNVGYLKGVRNLIEDIGDIDKDIKDILTNLIDNYDFDGIIEILTNYKTSKIN